MSSKESAKMPKLWSEGGLTPAQITRIETEFRVPVDNLFGSLRQDWILALAKESLLPDDLSLRILRDAIEWQTQHRFTDKHVQVVVGMALAAEGGWNTMTLYLDQDGWHGRRNTWNGGFPYWPARGMEGRAPGGTLVEVLGYILIGAQDYNDRPSAEWTAHKRSRPDLYGSQN